MMGDNLLPNDSLLLIRGVTILTALLHLLLLLRSCQIMDNVHDSSIVEMWDLVFETLHEAILKPVDIGLCGSGELHVLVHPLIQD